MFRRQTICILWLFWCVKALKVSCVGWVAEVSFWFFSSLIFIFSNSLRFNPLFLPSLKWNVCELVKLQTLSWMPYQSHVLTYFWVKSSIRIHRSWKWTYFGRNCGNFFRYRFREFGLERKTTILSKRNTWLSRDNLEKINNNTCNTVAKPCIEFDY